MTVIFKKHNKHNKANEKTLMLAGEIKNQRVKSGLELLKEILFL